LGREATVTLNGDRFRNTEVLVASLNQIFQRGGGIFRSGARQGERMARYGFSQANGLVRRVTNRSTPKDLDDVTLARKVETEIFRSAGAPKGKVDVNAVDGVVWLRGEVKRPEQIKALEAKARAIPEVRDVENLLHLPKTPAPSRTDTPKSQRRTRSARGGRERERKQGPRRITGQANAEKAPPEAEPSPAAKATTGTGREPPPFGSEETRSP
jgi:hypothetical protein